MQRIIVRPPDLNGAALNEFKDWLGITRPKEDALLLDLLGAAVAMCEAFTGQAPLEMQVEERLPPKQGRYHLSSRPVQMLAAAEEVAADGTRSSIGGQGHGFEIDAVGTAMADLKWSFDTNFVALQIVIGIAPEWSSVPKPLRQGIIRLASHYYRDRDHERATHPPASVAALWRPWRVMRLT